MKALITVAVKNHTGLEFTPTKGQRGFLKLGLTNYTEKQIADALPAQIDAWVQLLGDQLGVPDDARNLISPALIFDRLNLSAPITTAEGGTDDSTATERLGAKRGYALGFEVGASQLADPDIVQAYADILGRYPDPEGHAFWLVQKLGGMKIETIRGLMRAET